MFHLLFLLFSEARKYCVQIIDQFTSKEKADKHKCTGIFAVIQNTTQCYKCAVPH